MMGISKNVFMASLVFLFLCGFSTTADAIPITMQFTAADFSNVGGTASPLTDPVTGTIVWDAASVTSTIDSLTSISLTIDNRDYTLGAVGVLEDSTRTVIGGLVSGVQFINSRAGDDFGISWERSSMSDVFFTYAVDDIAGIFPASTISSFSITSASIPDASVIFLLGSSLIGLAVFGRKSKTG